MHRHLKDEIVPPDQLNPSISSGLAQIIELMMAKDPADRYRSAEELLEDLDAVESGGMPMHARSVMDIATVVSSMAAEGEESETMRPATRGGDTQGLNLALIAGLVLSVLANLILVAWVVSRA
jgi:serine/threonine protein kinase